MELLAVIVILAVILIIAMPKISDVIKNSKEASLETTAKLIASQAEKKYTENQVLDGSGTIKCSDVAKISDADYESCNITFDDKGNAKVTIVGKGKFEGMAVCDANKNSASISSECSTDASYFTYEELEKTYNVEVENIDKCKTYLMNLDGATEDLVTTLCTGGSISTPDGDASIKTLIEAGGIPSSDYETAGLKVETINNISITGYNIAGGTDVVIPSQIDGKMVVTIGNGAFYDLNTSLGITSVVIPKTVTNIENEAFRKNKITSIKFPDTPITLGCRVFDDNPITEDSSYSFPSNVVLPSQCVPR